MLYVTFARSHRHTLRDGSKLDYRKVAEFDGNIDEIWEVFGEEYRQVFSKSQWENYQKTYPEYRPEVFRVNRQDIPFDRDFYLFAEENTTITPLADFPTNPDCERSEWRHWPTPRPWDIEDDGAIRQLPGGICVSAVRHSEWGHFCSYVVFQPFQFNALGFENFEFPHEITFHSIEQERIIRHVLNGYTPSWFSAARGLMALGVDFAHSSDLKPKALPYGEELPVELKPTYTTLSRAIAVAKALAFELIGHGVILLREHAGSKACAWRETARGAIEDWLPEDWRTRSYNSLWQEWADAQANLQEEQKMSYGEFIKLVADIRLSRMRGS